MPKSSARPPKPETPRHYVREWRKFRKLTQERLAEKTPFTTGAISQLETGRTKYTQDMIEALAIALECKPGDVISRDPYVQDPPIQGEENIRSMLGRIKGLNDKDVDVALAVITNALQVNGAEPSRIPSENQSEPANLRRH